MCRICDSLKAKPIISLKELAKIHTERSTKFIRMVEKAHKDAGKSTLRFG